MEIYKARNLINGKEYVGKTVKGFESRKEKHLSSLNTDKKKHYPLYNDMRKYGIENFEWEVLEVCTTEKELDLKEKYWIEKLGTFYPNGYNLTKGGKGQCGFKHSEQSKLKISKNSYWLGKEGINKNKKFSDEHRRRLSEAHKGKPTKIVYDERIRTILKEQKLGSKNPMYGKAAPNRKKVINLDTLEIFDCFFDIQRQTNIKWTNVSKVCKGQRKTAGGFRWMYYDEYKSIPSQAD